jgi:hypothetical protein
MPRLRKFRVVIEYPFSAYEKGMDAAIDDIVGSSLTETGSGMDLITEVRDRSYEGTQNMVVCVVDKLMRKGAVSSISIRPVKR